MQPVLKPFLALLVAGFAMGGTCARAADWRFCIGVEPTAHEVVITDLFASAADSARLERRFESWFRARKNRTLVFQCPRGAAERVEALNAQTAALQFNRSMGFAVSSLSASDASAVAGPEM